MANKPDHPAYGDASNKRTQSGEIPQPRSAVDDTSPDLSKRGIVARSADASDWTRGPDAMPGVTEQMGLYGADLGNIAAVVSPRPTQIARMLSGFRHNHPFVPVYQLPIKVVTALLDGATAQYVNVPENAIVVMFHRGLLGDILVNFSGVAQAPGAALDLSGSLPVNDKILYYCYGLKQFSVFGTVANGLLGCAFYQTDASEMN